MTTIIIVSIIALTIIIIAYLSTGCRTGHSWTEWDFDKQVEMHTIKETERRRQLTHCSLCGEKNPMADQPDLIRTVTRRRFS